MAGAELGRRSENGRIAPRVVVGPHSRELDVKHADAGVREPGLRLPHEHAVVGERVQRLVRRHPVQAQPDVLVAGAGRGLDQLRRGQRQRAQMSEGEFVLHFAVAVVVPT